MTMRSLRVRAYAKINLSLQVGPKRSDGFHDIRTILQTIDLCDRLTFEKHRGPFRIVCTQPDVPTDRTNLIWRAAQRLWTAAGRDTEPADTLVTLAKRIPMQAGLGGGSSDAAVALVALRQFWKLRLSDDALFEIAASLGSDVPFFLIGGTALAMGRGEEVFPLEPLPRWWSVLIFPPFGISTADAYGWLDQARSRNVKPPEPRFLAGSWLGRNTPLVNDLEAPVVERHPVIASLVGQLTDLGAALSAMSGSGSTVFGIFQTTKAAEAAARSLGKRGLRTAIARLRHRL